MLKILWVPQFSSVRDNMYHITSDSNWNFFINLAHCLTLIDKNQLVLALPSNIESVDYEEVKKVAKHAKINYRRITTDVFGTRFDFDYDWAQNILKREMPDIIIENNPVHARAWKTAIKQLHINTKVVTYFHWIDSPSMPKVPKEISYWLRQIEGAISADLVLFNSDYAKSSFISEMKATVNTNYFDININNFKILQPSLNLDLKTYRKEKSEEPSILFNHRLSSLRYYRENYEVLIRFLRQFKLSHGWVPKTYFTNPSRKDLSDFPFEHELLSLSFSEYNDFIGSDEVNIAPNFFMNSKGMWSIASVGAGYLGNAVILPRKFGYAEIVPEDHFDYSGYFNTEIEAYHLFEKCILNKEFRQSLAEEFIEGVQYLRNDKIALNLNEMLKELVG